ncbi:integral peroxisomal membrane peroxin-domain-containing protein [Chytriomyces sp. MP71]|nr:integral peroxisomal membrane peroxin-domain-containing protein [Chytriomyces sp. MP71]
MSVLASALSELATQTAPNETNEATRSSPLSSFLLSSASSSSSVTTNSFVSSLPSSSLSASSVAQHSALPVPPLRSRPSIASLPMSSFPTALSGIPPTLQRKSVTRTTSAASSLSPELDVLQTSLAALARLDTLVDLSLLADSILAWSDATLSTLTLLSFWLVCAYPVLAFILPQCYLATWILFRYMSRGGARLARREPPPPRSDLQAVMDSIGSDRFARNLQLMQTGSALFCATFDALESLYTEHLTWRDPIKTARVVKALLASVPLALVGWMYLPGGCIRFGIAVAGGWVLLERTWIFLFCVHVVPKVLWRRAVQLAERVVTDLPLPDSIVDAVAASGIGWSYAKDSSSSSTHEASVKEVDQEDPDNITVEVFENQRWWAGPGWTSQMLTEERSPWSDAAGAIKLIPASHTNAPPLAHHVWTDPDWHLDTRWTGTDADGWVYSDHTWSKSAAAPGITSLTRRRRWTRRMRAVPPPPAPLAVRLASRKMSGVVGADGKLGQEGRKGSFWMGKGRESVVAGVLRGMRKRSVAQ